MCEMESSASSSEAATTLLLSMSYKEGATLNEKRTNKEEKGTDTHEEDKQGKASFTHAQMKKKV